MAASVGSPAPDVTLPDTAGEPVALADLKGRKALVVFMPFPFTGNCDGEACALRDGLADLNDLDASVVVITCTPRFSNAEWAKQNGFEFPVLSDYWPHGAVATAYGAFNDEVGAANRATYVLDADGVVREIIATDSLGITREYDEYLAALGRI